MGAKFKVGDRVVAKNMDALRYACIYGEEATTTFSRPFTVEEVVGSGMDDTGTIWEGGWVRHDGWCVPMSALELTQ